jgi:hypothetical protein
MDAIVLEQLRKIQCAATLGDRVRAITSLYKLGLEDGRFELVKGTSMRWYDRSQKTENGGRQLQQLEMTGSDIGQ